MQDGDWKKPSVEFDSYNEMLLHDWYLISLYFSDVSIYVLSINHCVFSLQLFVVVSLIRDNVLVGLMLYRSSCQRIGGFSILQVLHNP